VSSDKIRAGLTDVFAGTVCSILSIAYCLSYAALIFTGPLEPLLSFGIAVTFLSAAVGGAIVALRSSLPFAVAGPDSSISVVLAALVAIVVQRLVASGSNELLAPALIAMSLATALTGLLLWLLGVTRAGRAIRFIPYPVIGGFLGATGWLLITGALQVVTDQHPTLANVDAFFDRAIAAKTAAGAIVAVTLYVLLHRSKNPLVLPGVLLVAFAVTHLVLFSTGTTIAAAQASGWMFRLQAAAGLTLPWKLQPLHDFPWSSLPSLGGDVLAVMFVTATNFLLNTTGIEIASRTEADVEHDLKVLGLANVVIAAAGGYVSCTSFSRSMLARTAGATSRLSGLTVAAISAIVLVADPSFLGYVPKYILGGLLFYLGADLVYQWLISSSRRLLPLEYLSLLAIAFLIIYSGFIAGVLIGIVIGCATFALSASRVSAIKFNFDGSEYRSSLDRGPYELSLLTDHGRKIQGMALQSYLFFGSANRLYQHVRSLLTTQPDCHFLIFDFRLVTGIDSSATHSFAQIKLAAAASGAEIVLVNLTPELERAFRTAGFISDNVIVASDLDRALEACEQRIIEAHRTEGDDARSLQSWLSDALGNAQHADRLAGYCRRLEVGPGDIVARQGDTAASMHFILEGRVGIVVNVGDGRTTRVRSLGRHTSIGEMGLITGRPRSATIQAEADSVLYELSAEDYERIKRDDPALSLALLGYVVSVMAERLNFANRAVGILQR
jgi:SulP family sulfate permease